MISVCLPTCGHGSGNGTPCAGRAICASFDPLGVYIYAVGVESCATRLPLLRSVPLTDPNRGRAWHPRELGQGDAYSSLATGKSSTPPARCIHHSRHDASSVGYRLLASFAPGVASREPESRRSPALAPRIRRLGPTFRCGAFFLAASALADVPSARLTTCAKFHHSTLGGFDIMFESCESGAMAQRGEIQCAESQFALQSSRLTKLRNFHNRRHYAEETHKRLPLFVFRLGLLRPR